MEAGGGGRELPGGGVAWLWQAYPFSVGLCAGAGKRSATGTGQAWLHSITYIHNHRHTHTHTQRGIQAHGGVCVMCMARTEANKYL